MKAQIIPLVAVIVTSALTGFAQVSNSVAITETRISNPYHFIVIKGEMNVKLVQDETPAITIQGVQYQIDNTVTLLRNDTLFVYQTNERNSDARSLVLINVDNISLLEVSGKTKVDCSGLINADFLTIRAHNGAHIKVNVHALKVDSKATESSFIEVSGSAAREIQSTEGTGRIDAHLLDVLDAREPAVNFCGAC